MKGIMADTLTLEDFENKESLSISLEVKHLRYWYLQPMPTYLVVYVDSVDKFLILNIQNYVTEHWGRDILSLDQKTATVHIPTDSELDNQAFYLILVKSDIEEWKKALESEEGNVRLCRRDYNLIWHLGTAEERCVQHRVVFWDWFSKNRSQLYILERALAGDTEWENLREHWQAAMSVYNLESEYPYVEFYSLEHIDAGEDIWGDKEEEDEYDDVPPVALSNGNVVRGVNFCFEYFEYCFGMRLNELGKEMLSWIQTLAISGLVEIDPGKSEFISIAPWHGRAV
jgi:hypothetical protein